MELTCCRYSDGRTIRFWKDKWREAIPARDFPHLFFFARQPDINLKQLLIIKERNLLDHFNLPLSMIAYHQSDTVAEQLESPTALEEPGRWLLNNEGKFSV